MPSIAPVSILSSDDPLLKNERSAMLIEQARRQMPDAEFMIFTSSDFQSTGDANLSVLENELIDPGLFGGDRIIKIYLSDLNKTAAQVLMLIAQRIRPGILVIIDLPRIQRSYEKLAPKPFTPVKNASIKILTESAVSFIKGIGGSLEIMYPPAGEELIQFILKRAASLKLRCDRNNAQYIAACLEGNLVSLVQALQLIAFTAPNAELTPELLDKIMIQDSRFSGFEVAQAVLEGNCIRALNALNSFCQASYSPVESLGQVISQLDSALSAIPNVKSAHLERMDARTIYAFFLKLNIKTLPMQKALQKAALSMPPQLYDFLCHELARASRYLSSFECDKARACLETLCAAVGNFAAMKLQPLN